MTSRSASSMSTQIPTDDPSQAVTVATAPAGAVPDAATLTRWANELFSAVPGGEASRAPVSVPIPGAPIASGPMPSPPPAPSLPTVDTAVAEGSPGFQSLAALVD